MNTKILKDAKKVRPLSLMIGVILMGGLTACQSAPKIQTLQSATTGQAKLQLQSVMTEQLRSNFGYDTKIALSNHAYVDALTQKHDGGELALSNNKMQYCEAKHTHEYKTLLDKASSAGLDISADYYLSDKETLEQNYLNCVAQRERYFPTYNLNARISPEVFFAQPENQKGLVRQRKPAEASQIKEAFESYQNTAEYANDGWTGVDGEYLPDVDVSHTQADFTRAKLVQTYLLEPTQIQITGSYRPLQGVVSFLPTVRYEQKNLEMMVNQPIYLDFRKGVIYVWADNLALVNSQMLDDELGLAWQNKWLALPINDGTLPEGFHEDFFKSYLNAQKAVFHAKSENQFSFVSQDDVTAKNLVMINDLRAVLPSAQTIILEQSSVQQKNAEKSQLITLWYDDMTQKYPVLLEKIPAADSPERISERLTSKVIMQRFFAWLKSQQNTHHEAESHDNQAKMSSAYYGIQGNRLLWLYRTHHWLDNQAVSGSLSLENCLSKEALADSESADDVDDNCLTVQEDGDEYADNRLHAEVASLTVFKPMPSAVDFPRLPSTVNTPNANNSINLLNYGQDLVGRLKDQEANTAQLLMRVLVGAESDDHDVDDETESTNIYDECRHARTAVEDAACNATLAAAEAARAATESSTDKK